MKCPDQYPAVSCSQCDKQRIVNVDGHDLCVDCYHKFVTAQTLQFQQHAAMMNLALAEMDALVPVGPSFQVDMPKIPNGAISNTTVTVTGGTVGAINTGTVRSIVVTMKGLEGAGHLEIAGALQRLTDAILATSGLDAEGKNEALEQVEFLASQAAAGPEERKMGTLKPVLEGLSTTLAGVADLAAVWEAVGPVIRSAMGL